MPYDAEAAMETAVQALQPVVVEDSPAPPALVLEASEALVPEASETANPEEASGAPSPAVCPEVSPAARTKKYLEEAGCVACKRTGVGSLFFLPL